MTGVIKNIFSPNATWLELEACMYKEIRAIYFDDDYINSLKLILPSITSVNK